MNKFLGILIVIGIGIVGWRFAERYQRAKDEAVDPRQAQIAPEPIDRSDPGMALELEASFEAAKAQGAATLKNWLFRYRFHVREPRLSEIELDYILMVQGSDPVEARKVFAEVKRRHGPKSPLANRIERLAKTYE